MTVLDPFMGTGTTAVACVELGIHYIGFEIDPTYHATAVARVNDALAASSQRRLDGFAEDTV